MCSFWIVYGCVFCLLLYHFTIFCLFHFCSASVQFGVLLVHCIHLVLYDWKHELRYLLMHISLILWERFFFCFFSSSMKNKLLQKDYVINITKARAKMFGADFIQYLVFGYVVTFHPLFDQFFIFLLFHCCCFLCIFSLFRVRFVIFIFVIFLLFVSFAFILDWKSIAYS